MDRAFRKKKKGLRRKKVKNKDSKAKQRKKR